MKSNVINFPGPKVKVTPKGLFVITIGISKDMKDTNASEIILKCCNVICSNGYPMKQQELFKKIEKMDMEQIEEWTENTYNKYITDADILNIFNQGGNINE
jgi:hypothetical protein